MQHGRVQTAVSGRAACWVRSQPSALKVTSTLTRWGQCQGGRGAELPGLATTCFLRFHECLVLRTQPTARAGFVRLAGVSYLDEKSG